MVRKFLDVTTWIAIVASVFSTSDCLAVPNMPNHTFLFPRSSSPTPPAASAPLASSGSELESEHSEKGVEHFHRKYRKTDNSTHKKPFVKVDGLKAVFKELVDLRKISSIHRHHHQKDHGIVSSSTAANSTTTRPATDDSDDSKSSGSSERRSAAKAMLSALSFERPLTRLFRGHRKTGSDSGSLHSHHADQENESSKDAKKDSTKRSETTSPPPVRLPINHSLRAYLDPDGSVDVFYDTYEEGDGENDNEFLATCRRESVVLSSVRSLHALISDDEEEGKELVNEKDDPNDDACTAQYPPPPRPPAELPLRFLRAGKNKTELGLKRYEDTLEWRKKERIDTILREPNPHFDLIKQQYPHFCHGHGKNGEPCYYEQPPKTDLKALRAGGVTLDLLLRHYIMVTEFQWQVLERDDLQRSIYVIDLEGMGFGDFVGEVVDFVKRASALSAQHYPERAGCVFVINVPSWFKMIWNVLKPMVDEDTLKKIYILRGAEEIRQNMQEHIDLDNIPADYGGNSVSLGQSQEELLLADLIKHNNYVSESGGKCCNGGRGANPPCQWCTWQSARSY